MKAGRLDRRITIQRKQVSQSDSGQPIETWSILVTVWASVGPLRGDEVFSAPQYVGKQQTEYRIRFSTDVADLTPLDRIVYPAINSGDPVPERSVYNIFSVNEIGRREGFQIVAFRRADL